MFNVVIDKIWNVSCALTGAAPPDCIIMAHGRRNAMLLLVLSLFSGLALGDSSSTSLGLQVSSVESSMAQLQQEVQELRRRIEVRPCDPGRVLLLYITCPDSYQFCAQDPKADIDLALSGDDGFSATRCTSFRQHLCSILEWRPFLATIFLPRGEAGGGEPLACVVKKT